MLLTNLTKSHTTSCVAGRLLSLYFEIWHRETVLNDGTLRDIHGCLNEFESGNGRIFETVKKTWNKELEDDNRQPQPDCAKYSHGNDNYGRGVVMMTEVLYTTFGL